MVIIFIQDLLMMIKYYLVIVSFSKLFIINLDVFTKIIIMVQVKPNFNRCYIKKKFNQGLHFYQNYFSLIKKVIIKSNCCLERYFFVDFKVKDQSDYY